MKAIHQFNTNEYNELMIGSVTVSDLVKKYKTPLYAMDEQRIEHQIELIKQSFSHPSIETEVIYAGKAFLVKEMVKLIERHSLSLDVVSIGEFYTAIKAGFNPKNIYFHGNNKTKDELIYAIKHQVGHIVVDNQDEFELLKSIETNDYPQLLLRINTGVEAHTHEYIKTTHHNSKFGVSAFDPNTIELIKDMNSSSFPFMGIHAHIGSQIFEIESFKQHTIEMIMFAKKLKDEANIKVEAINLGGGFGVKYTSDDQVPSLELMLHEVIETAYQYIKQFNLDVKKMMIEPGRSIVADAGVTIYEVGGVKTTFGQKNYVFVDGSMADHMRTALYQAKYEAVIANKVFDEDKKVYTIAGKACESGDMIIHDIKLPLVEPKDLLVVFTTGAYHYSMASNYNRLTKPAVVFVNGSESRIVVKRETLDDLLRNDL